MEVNCLSKEYSAYIVDVDGTLYFQPNLRINMIWTILRFLMLHPWRFRDILIVFLYRRIREARKFVSNPDFVKKEIEYVANKVRKDPQDVTNTIAYWMEKVPKEYLVKHRDKKLIAFLNEKYSINKKVIIYSDYPYREKLEGMDLLYNRGYYSDDESIKCMKPEEKGLINILHENDLISEECLFIGDRYEKDGQCAEHVGMDYFILPRRKSKRNKLWNSMEERSW